MIINKSTHPKPTIYNSQLNIISIYPPSIHQDPDKKVIHIQHIIKKLIPKYKLLNFRIHRIHQNKVAAALFKKLSHKQKIM
jgi:hypothetical protein